MKLDTNWAQSNLKPLPTGEQHAQPPTRPTYLPTSSNTIYLKYGNCIVCQHVWIPSTHNTDKFQNTKLCIQHVLMNSSRSITLSTWNNHLLPLICQCLLHQGLTSGHSRLTQRTSQHSYKVKASNLTHFTNQLEWLAVDLCSNTLWPHNMITWSNQIQHTQSHGVC